MDKTEEALTRGVEQVLSSKNGLADLMKKKKITLYQGFDPSMPSLHLGNLVGLMKLRQFQKLGHKVIFLVGDFTGMIGDPSGKSESRKPLSRQQVTKNAKHYKDQASLVLKFDGKNPAKLLFNSQWLDKISFAELLRLSSFLTYQQVKERNMFRKRVREGKDIYINEFLYPLMQGYDSVHMDVDLEVGGNDQLFNMMTGRDLMHKIKGKEKFVLTTKLLVDKEGNKIGKTTGNALFLDSSPQDFYGGVMAFPDETIYLAFELLTEVDLDGLKEKIKKDPMGMKKKLAFEIVKILHGEKKAQEAQKHFEKTFQDKTPKYEVKIPLQNSFARTIAPFTSKESVSQAKQYIAQGAVDVDNNTITDAGYKLKMGDQIRIGSTVFGTITKK